MLSIVYSLLLICECYLYEESRGLGSLSLFLLEPVFHYFLAQCRSWSWGLVNACLIEKELSIDKRSQRSGTTVLILRKRRLLTYCCPSCPLFSCLPLGGHVARSDQWMVSSNASVTAHPGEVMVSFPYSSLSSATYSVDMAAL